MDKDTDIGGPQHRFPTTSHSAIVAARSDNQQVRQRALAIIVASYWKPAYKYIRFKWQASNEDAKDLTQGFFATAIEKNYFNGYDSAKASFQTFLRTCLDRYVANQKKAEQRKKRGGDAKLLSVDFSSADEEIARHGPSQADNPEDYFRKEWVRSLFALAIETLSLRYDESGRSVYFKLFELYDLNDENAEPKVSYASLAEQFGLDITQVTNYLAAARRDFRKVVLEKLQQLTATDEEFRTEARELLGVEVK